MVESSGVVGKPEGWEPIGGSQSGQPVGTGIGTSPLTSKPHATNQKSHESNDADQSKDAVHHSLGKTAFQAAAGDHVHHVDLVGEVKFYAGQGVPDNYFVCNGVAISRTTYAALFVAIDTAYGVGDGSTTFNIPDLVGRYLMGGTKEGIGNTPEVLADRPAGRGHTHRHNVAGTPSTYVPDVLPTHTHTFTDPSHTHAIPTEAVHTHTIPTEASHTHPIANASLTVANDTTIGGAANRITTANHDHGGVTSTDGAHAHGGNTGAGGSHAHGGVTAGGAGTGGITAAGGAVTPTGTLNITNDLIKEHPSLTLIAIICWKP